MIEQLLNQEFVHALAAGSQVHVEATLAEREQGGQGGRRGRRGANPLKAVESDDLKKFLEALRTVEEPSSAPFGPEPGEPVPKDDLAYIPRSQLLNILQSAVEEQTEERAPKAIKAPRRRLTTGRRGRVPAVTDVRLKDVKLDQVSQERRIWRRMEVAKGKWIWLSDPRWAVCKAAELWRDAVTGHDTFVEKPPTVRIANDARIILVGDWGSGLKRAQKVAGQIREELEKGGRRQQIVIHLGDVYYSGTKREFERRFLAHWPVDRGQEVLSFSLPGNHDMYTGGYAYYNTCLADSRFRAQEGCSYFALENDHWQLLGLDSAHEDAGLHGGQAKWARELIEKAPSPKKTALLSHHQLFSAHEGGAEGLANKIGPVLATERVDAWFWGHEHRCIQYAETRFGRHRVGFASCVGHGGIPEYLVKEEASTEYVAAYEYRRQFGGGLEPWGTFGFAVVEPREGDMSVRYVDEDGREHHSVPSIVGAAK